MNGAQKNLPTLSTLRKRLDSGEANAKMLLAEAQDSIAKKDTEIHAFLEVFSDAAEEAQKIDERMHTEVKEGKNKNASPLLGIPIAIKDNITIEGKHATAGSKILENYVAPYDATVITKLRSAGAVIVGRTNMDEFAMGSSTERSAWGPTKNPWDTSRVPGGSSGGSAAAVALGAVSVALGSDTGGSIRQPASYCGLVGLKPTYGAVSRYGLIAMGSSLDCIGPLTNTVADSKTLFEIIRGNDSAHDATSVPNYILSTPQSPLTIGVPRAFLTKGIDADVMERFEETLSALSSAGNTIVPIELPTIAYSLPVYYIVMPAEVSSNLARFDGVKYGSYESGDSRIEDLRLTRQHHFGEEVRRRIMLGTYVLSSGYYDAYYGKALQVRRRISSELAAVFKKVDVIATPTTPTPAFRCGEKTNDPLLMYLEDIFTVPANIAGIPALSVPMKNIVRDTIPLPIGIQFMAREYNEGALFKAGAMVTGETL